MRRPGAASVVLIWEVANRHRGDDPVPRFLRKIVRTLDDMLDGRTVRRWRLERLERFFDDLSKTSLAASQVGWRCVRR